MKRRMLIMELVILICTFSTGCVSKEQIEKNSDSIRQYVKDTISGNWTYEDSKLSIDSDYTTTITLYNVDDWVSCVKNSEQFSKLLKNNLRNDIKMKKIYFACKSSANDDVNSYVEIDDITNINIENYKNEVHALDNSKNQITEKYDDAAIRLKKEYIDKCNVYDYKEIFRYSNNYIGKYARFTGEVIQVFESDGYYSLRVNVTNNDGWYEDTIFVSLPTEALNGRILEQDIITIYGKLSGLYEYESIFGEPITIPFLNAEYAELQ